MEMPCFTTLKNILKSRIKFWNITARQQIQAYFNSVSSLRNQKQEARKKTRKLFPQAFVMSANGQKKLTVSINRSNKTEAGNSPSSVLLHGKLLSVVLFYSWKGFQQFQTQKYLQKPLTTLLAACQSPSLLTGVSLKAISNIAKLICRLKKRWGLEALLADLNTNVRKYGKSSSSGTSEEKSTVEVIPQTTMFSFQPKDLWCFNTIR